MFINRNFNGGGVREGGNQGAKRDAGCGMQDVAKKKQGESGSELAEGGRKIKHGLHQTKNMQQN